MVAVMPAPAALPAGTMALYGQIGAPDVGAGYRQGFDGLEIEAKGPGMIPHIWKVLKNQSSRVDFKEIFPPA